MPLSEESPKVTTRHACSSLVARLVRAISARIFTGWCRKNRPPCAFITIVSVSSLNSLPSAFLLEARTGMLIQSRRLRRSVLICTFDMVQAIVQAGQSLVNEGKSVRAQKNMKNRQTARGAFYGRQPES